MKVFLFIIIFVFSAVFSQENWIQEISFTREQKVLFKSHIDEFRLQQIELQENLRKINDDFQNIFITASKEEDLKEILKKKMEIEKKIQEIKTNEIIKIWSILSIEQRKIFASHIPRMMEPKLRGRNFQNKNSK